jgi:outer membrane protein assembly factor BamB
MGPYNKKGQRHVTNHPIRSRPHAALFLRLAFALSLVALASCGGGGGGGGGTTVSAGNGGSSSSSGGSSTPQPTIRAVVITFPTSGVPPAFLPAGLDSAAAVQITDQSGTSIASAFVTIDGTSLEYVATDQQYEGTLTINPGETVTVTANVNGVTYTASHTNFSTYPSITAPAAGSTWSLQSANLISWSGAVPDASSQYAAGVFTPTGTLVWPTGGTLQNVPSNETSTTVSPNSLTTGNYLVLVGIIDVLAFPGAAGGSGVAIGGFTYVPVTVSMPAPIPQSVAISPTTVTISAGKSLQLSATASYPDGTTQDVTASANWSSSDTTKVTVGATGAVTGIAAGTATVTAEYAGFSANTTVTVFQPNPSPTPPLSESVAYQIDYAHSGRATVGAGGPTFPPTAHWSVTLSGSSISYPIIAAGKVFVTTNAAPQGQMYGTTLYALDETTGNTVWGPTPLSGTYGSSGVAYDHGTLFVINYDGLLRTFDAATGTPGWSRQIPGVTQVTAAPTAANGIVYVNGSGGSAAIDESNGSVLSIGPGGDGADSSSPAVSPNGVFLSGPCDALKLDPISATVLWHFDEGCSGGGGRTDAYANNSVYVRGLFNPSAGPQLDLVLDAATGKQLGTFNATVIPAFSATAGFFLNGTTLTATDLSTSSILWSFSGDGMLDSAPIVIDSVVVVGSSSGTVYALDATSGSVLWSSSAGAPIAGPDEQNATVLTGFGSGDGYLVVPAGNILNGWRIVP